MKHFAKKETLLGISATYFKYQINRKDEYDFAPHTEIKMLFGQCLLI